MLYRIYMLYSLGKSSSLHFHEYSQEAQLHGTNSEGPRQIRFQGEDVAGFIAECEVGGWIVGIEKLENMRPCGYIEIPFEFLTAHPPCFLVMPPSYFFAAFFVKKAPTDWINM